MDAFETVMDDLQHLAASLVVLSTEVRQEAEMILGRIEVLQRQLEERGKGR